MKKIRYICFLFVLSILILSVVEAKETESYKHSFPRIIGMAIGKKNYDDPVYRHEISRVDVLIVGFYPGWGRYKGNNAENIAVKAIKKLNKNILVGQYTIMSEAPDSHNMKSASRDIGKKIDDEDWWLRDASGNRVQWTDKYNKWDVNVSVYTSKDSEGLRFPQWIVHRDYQIYFKNNPALDIWFLDNALSKPPAKLADWNRDGRNDENLDPVISRQFRLANVAEWNEIKKLVSGIFLIGNSDDISFSEYQFQLNGVFMEALIGRSWSMERWRGWQKVMQRYWNSMQYSLPPHLVGFNVWGDRKDYQRMRYGLTSCLMNDGYFSYTDEKVGYASVPWFDEYDVDLGFPLQRASLKPWKNGVYRRVFEKGMVLVNPTNSPKKVRIEAGYRRFLGKQDPHVNNGEMVREPLTLNAKDGIILIRSE